MATIFKTRQGHWRAQVRRKRKYLSNTFRLKTQAHEWVRDVEHLIDIGGEPKKQSGRRAQTVGALVDLHLEDLRELGRPIRRSKMAVMETLKRDLGAIRIDRLDRSLLIQYGKQRAAEGAGPVTLAVDLSYLRTVLTHAAAVHGVQVNTESIRLARAALSRLGLVGRSHERDRRPTEDEVYALLGYFDTKTNMIIPMGRIVRFAIATAMRQEEICKIEWPDVDLSKRLVTIRDRKDPRNKGRQSPEGATSQSDRHRCLATPSRTEIADRRSRSMLSLSFEIRRHRLPPRP